MARILFILKRRPDYNQQIHNHVGLSTGLYNSVRFMDTMLQEAGVESKMFVAIDNNCIDREVRAFKPTHVVIEALWVVPTKFVVLSKLHPNVTWIIRLHSEMPFIASEGIAMDWLGDYARFTNIIIGVNAPRMLEETKTFLSTVYDWSDDELDRRVVYMPNFYPQEYKTKPFNSVDKEYIDISCFGAIRPLKNHLLQAICAVEFAESLNKRCRFHINSGRIEMKGEPILNNLKGMFQHLADKGHELVSHEWVPREQFLEICASMDIGMQASISETFNIVAADHLSQGVPVVTSREMPWAVRWFCANPVERTNILKKLKRVWNHPQINVLTNQYSLTAYTNQTRKIWLNYFRDK
jgi:hypothetical protein